MIQFSQGFRPSKSRPFSFNFFTQSEAVWSAESIKIFSRPSELLTRFRWLKIGRTSLNLLTKADVAFLSIIWAAHTLTVGTGSVSSESRMAVGCVGKHFRLLLVGTCLTSLFVTTLFSYIRIFQKIIVTSSSSMSISTWDAGNLEKVIVCSYGGGGPDPAVLEGLKSGVKIMERKIMHPHIKQFFPIVQNTPDYK